MKPFLLIASLLLASFVQGQDWHDRWSESGSTWKEKWTNTLDAIDTFPIDQQIEILGSASKIDNKNPTETEKREQDEISNRARKALMEIPGHAIYYKNKLESIRSEIKRDSKIGEIDWSKPHFGESDYDKFRVRELFPVLSQLPSPETISVLGYFLNDPEGRDGKTVLGVPFDHQGEGSLTVNAEKAAIALNNLGIDHPPAKSPLIDPLRRLEDPQDVDRWKDWWNEVKSGKRTYRFIGSPIEYGPDGPVSAKEVQRRERDRQREKLPANSVPSNNELVERKSVENPPKWPILISLASVLLLFVAARKAFSNRKIRFGR